MKHDVSGILSFFFFNFAEVVVEIELTLDFEVIRGF